MLRQILLPHFIDIVLDVFPIFKQLQYRYLVRHSHSISLDTIMTLSVSPLQYIAYYLQAFEWTLIDLS